MASVASPTTTTLDSWYTRRHRHTHHPSERGWNNDWHHFYSSSLPVFPIRPFHRLRLRRRRAYLKRWRAPDADDYIITIVNNTAPLSACFARRPSPSPPLLSLLSMTLLLQHSTPHLLLLLFPSISPSSFSLSPLSSLLVHTLSPLAIAALRSLSTLH